MDGACMSKTKVKLRKYLNADELFSLAHFGFEEIKDHRQNNIKILSRCTYAGFCHVFPQGSVFTCFKSDNP
ncbi:MAG: hypothetical protein C5S49_02470 [Candidatus Methanogaster sp.]|nr:MAG: hypothetical protein C5S49_02470 [ANME-2 cluster archaeon]